MIENAEITDENPDFGRGLFVCEKPGLEFAQRLVQGGRTDEPTPVISMDRLGE